MILYHFPTSPFARRVRLTLALKGLTAELRDARANAEYNADVRRLNPLATVPVLVDGDRVIPDSAAICHYLDRKVPQPALWPSGLAGAEAFELTALADTSITILVDLGMRYFTLTDHPSFPGVRAEMVGRAQRGIDKIAERAGSGRVSAEGFLCGDRWSGADIAVYTTVTWLEGLPVRAQNFEPAKRMIALGWTLPPALSAWAARHRQRDDVRSLG